MFYGIKKRLECKGMVAIRGIPGENNAGAECDSTKR